MKSLLNTEVVKKMDELGMPEIENVRCDRCNKLNTYKVNEDGTKELVLKCDCHFQDEVQASMKRVKQRKINYYFNQSLINPELRKASFKNSNIDFQNASPSIVNAYQTASQFCKSFSLEEPQTLVIHGGTGTGKSYLAYSTARYLKDKGYTVLFIDNVELLSLIKSSFNKKNDDTEENIMRMVSEVDLLVLDDVGANKSTDWASEKLYEITNKRQGMNTIYTTNLNLYEEEPVDIMLQRSYSRICNGATIIELDGKDRRMS